MTEKAEIIQEAYETNFGTAYETYKIAAKRNPSIRLQDVKGYLNKLESVQTHFKYKTIIALFPVSFYLNLRLI